MHCHANTSMLTLFFKESCTHFLLKKKKKKRSFTECLIVLLAARTEDDAVVEVFVIRVLWIQTSSKSAVFRRATI